MTAPYNEPTSGERPAAPDPPHSASRVPYPLPAPTSHPQPYPPASGPPAAGLPASGWPVSGPPVSGPPVSGPAWGLPPIPGYGFAPPPPRRRSIAAIFALVLVLLLGVVAGVEGYLIYRLDKNLAAAEDELAASQTNDDGRLDRLEGRASELEKKVGSEFDPAAVAAATLPSVFRIRAGQFSGTAFAVGRETASGGTYLFTNYHVVEAVWVDGERTVFLERENQRFPATITKVDQAEDVALLEVKEKFPRLATATEKVKPGEQVAVVGAPLGLTGSVTTGVVSTYRKVPEVASEVVQFDAAINPGNSGGPVINSQKQVVGIATLKARAEGIGLAVQITIACRAMAVC